MTLHSAPTQLTETAHMRFLHSCGYLRAVLLMGEREIRPGLSIVHFHNNQPALDMTLSCKHVPTPWPTPQPVHQPRKTSNLSTVNRCQPEYCLFLGIDCDVLVELFKSSTEVLCPWYKHLDVPDFVSQGISAGAPMEGQRYDLSAFDRLVIYTDCSSKSHNRHRPPLLIADVGQPDAWAYVVLGETYPQNGKPGSCKLERMKTPNSQCTERCRWLKVTKPKKQSFAVV